MQAERFDWWDSLGGGPFSRSEVSEGEEFVPVGYLECMGLVVRYAIVRREDQAAQSGEVGLDECVEEETGLDAIHGQSVQFRKVE